MNSDKGGLVEKDLTEVAIGAFFAVYNDLGFGFLEQVYENALAIVLREAGLTVLKQAAVDVHYRGKVVGEYRADLLIPGRLLIEVKAASTIVRSHEAQLLNYLKATGLPVGLLFNFGPTAQFKRRAHFGSSIRLDPCSSVAKEDV